MTQEYVRNQFRGNPFWNGVFTRGRSRARSLANGRTHSTLVLWMTAVPGAPLLLFSYFSEKSLQYQPCEKKKKPRKIRLLLALAEL